MQSYLRAILRLTILLTLSGLGLSRMTQADVFPVDTGHSLTAGLHAYYKLDDTGDASGNGNNLTNNNSVVFDPGKIGNAADFGPNNTNKYLSMMNTLGIDGGPVSISLWVRVDSQPSTNTNATIVYQENTSSHIVYRIGYYDQSGTKGIWCDRETPGNGSTPLVQFTYPLTTGTWYHIVYRYDGTTEHCFVNDVNQATTTATLGGSAVNIAQGFAIGGQIDGSDPLSGKVDEVGVWSRSLTNQEVQDLYNNGCGDGYGAPATAGCTTDCLPSQTDHSVLLSQHAGGAEWMLFSSPVTINGIALWTGGHFDFDTLCCSDSFVSLYKDTAGQIGSLIATSGMVRIGRSQPPQENTYGFANPLTLAPGAYWFTVTEGPTVFTNSTLVFGDANHHLYSRIDGTCQSSAPRQTIFLVHGIAQDASAMLGLAGSLLDPGFGIDSSRFAVDAADFGFGLCANNVGCDRSLCTIQNGAQKLATYINKKNPLGDIVLLGYSMGGLIARDMILNNYANVITNHHVAALITLATPHLGYPYDPLDGQEPAPFGRCDSLAGQMFGDFLTLSAVPLLPEVARDSRGNLVEDFADVNGNHVRLSGYLYDLNTSWVAGSFVGPDQWVAIAGSYCAVDQKRFGRGCPNGTRSDGVVCVESAGGSIDNGPTSPPFPDDEYSHTADFSPVVLFCNMVGSKPLYNPPKDGTVFGLIQATINGLP